MDDSPGDLLLGVLRLDDDPLGVVEEAADRLHHAHRLVEGAVVVVRGERVLLQVVFSDDFSNLKKLAIGNLLQAHIYGPLRASPFQRAARSQ